jgi:hypothetical protein
LAHIGKTLDLAPCTLEVDMEGVAAHFDKDAAWKNRCGEIAVLWLDSLKTNLAKLCTDATVKVPSSPDRIHLL